LKRAKRHPSPSALYDRHLERGLELLLLPDMFTNATNPAAIRRRAAALTLPEQPARSPKTGV
jgi:hypothetical protein